MKYIMFATGQEVRHNMQDAALEKISYFVDNGVCEMVGTFMGKPIYAPDVLKHEDSDNVIIFVGSTTHRAEIMCQLLELGDYRENKNVFWAPNWHGNDDCPPFYYVKNQWEYLYKKNIDEITGHYFHTRAKLVYSLMRVSENMSVMDVGAGGMLIKKYLPKTCKYIPIDLYSDETIVVNLDEHEFPKFCERVEYVLLGDTLVHVRDWKWLLQETSKYSDKLIISMVPLEIFPDIKQRADHGWVTHIYSHELILFMQEIGYVLTHATERHHMDNIYLFERMKIGR